MTQRALPLLLLVLGVACVPPGPRKALFGSGEPEAQLAGPVALPPARLHDPTEGEELLARLRAADKAKREQIVRGLIQSGPKLLPTVEQALADERLVVDVLEEVARQLSEEVESKGERTEGRVSLTDWVQTKYKLALDRYLAGDTFGAIRVVDAIVALEPGTELRGKLRRLRHACEERLLRESVLAADLVTATTTVLPGESLRVKVRLKNLSRDTVELRLAEDRRLGTVNVDYEELSPDGTRTRIRTQRPVRAAKRVLVLRPGQLLDLPVQLPAAHQALPEGKVGRYHLGGRLRAQTMLVGEGSFTMFVPLFAADVVVLSPADVGLAKDPRLAFTEAVAEAGTGTRRSRLEPARRAFVAAILLAQEQREVALEVLATSLEAATGPLSDAICAALGRATGEPLSFTRQEWLIWWKGRESRPSKGSTAESQ